MHGLKSAILAIFQKSANWLDWPCPVSAALQNRSQDLFSLLYFDFHLFFEYETIVRSRASSAGHSDPDSSSVIMRLPTCRYSLKTRFQKLIIFVDLIKTILQGMPKKSLMSE